MALPKLPLASTPRPRLDDIGRAVANMIRWNLVWLCIGWHTIGPFPGPIAARARDVDL
jgi:hypothetical protein